MALTGHFALVRDLLRVLPADAGKSFDSNLQARLCSQGSAALLHGFTNTQLHLYISESLSATAAALTDSGDHITSNLVWSPVIAMLLKRYFQVDPGPDTGSARADQREKDVPPVMPIVNPPSLPKAVEKQIGTAERIPYNKVAAKLTVAPQPSTALSQIATAICKERKKKRKEQQLESGLHPPPQGAALQLNRLAYSNDKPLYHLSGWINCTSVKCRFCRGMFENTTITRCGSSDKRTPCQGTTVCHPSGWFPHLGQKAWQMIKRYHGPSAEYGGPRMPHCLANFNFNTNKRKLQDMPEEVQLGALSLADKTLQVVRPSKLPASTFTEADICTTDSSKISEPPDDPTCLSWYQQVEDELVEMP